MAEWTRAYTSSQFHYHRQKGLRVRAPVMQLLLGILKNVSQSMYAIYNCNRLNLQSDYLFIPTDYIYHYYNWK